LPELLIMPHVVPLHPTPETLHITVSFVELCTVAENCIGLLI